MTEHSKIPLPKGDSDGSDDGEARPVDESSLLERASGAFGFDPFKPAPFSGKLPDAQMKRATVRRKEAEAREAAKPAPAPVVEPPVAPATPPVASPMPVPVAYQPPVEENLPVPASRTDIVVPEPVSSVELSGASFPIDREHLRAQGMIVPDAAAGALREEFRIVKRRIIATAQERGTALSRRVLVSSAHPGEGKTFCATNLAIAMASERDVEVLLVDGDIAKPSILTTLGLPRGPGFMDCLADPEVQPEDLVIGTDISGLWVLPAGNQTNADSEYVASARTADVLDRLTIGAPQRIVIFDSPPALAASPAAELAKHVGQTVLVARADTTGQNALEDAYQLLSGCADIKLLLNATQFSPSGRSFGSYYGYEE